MTFDEATHRYVVYDRGQRVQPPSITTVLGVINKPALIQWAVNQGIDLLKARLTEGEFTEDELDQILEEARYAHKFRKQEAAAIGTQAHNWLEKYWRLRMDGVDPDTLALPEEPLVKNCVSAGVKWIQSHRIEPILIEKPVYSRRHQVSGRLDKLARVDGRLAIVDWKSSTGLWPEYILQTAAYNEFLEEERPDLVVEDRWLVKLGKYDGDFHAARFERETKAKDFEAFLGALTLYRRLQELNRRS